MRARLTGRFAVVAGIAVCLSAAFLAWFEYVAILEWRRSSTLLAEQRAIEAVDRFVLSLTRDMQGAQRNVLMSADRQELARDLPYSAFSLAASAFARFPYVESFFAWHRANDSTLPVFFNRRDRLPPWVTRDDDPNRFPVVLGSDATVARLLLKHIEIDANEGRSFSVFEEHVGDIPYQVVARLAYEDVLNQRLEHVFGFTVNLRWARQFYFVDLMNQFARIEGRTGDVTLGVIDDQGGLVAGTQPGMPGLPQTRRTFPLMFFDPLLVITQFPTDTTRKVWTIEGAPSGDARQTAALGGANRLLTFSGIAAAVLIAGLVLTVRAVRASAELAEVRSDFVSSVSHELKAPLAIIRAAGDSLAAGRVQQEAGRRDYARIIVQEAKRLTRLVDNLLALSRVTDLTTTYAFEPSAVDVLVEAALQRLQLPLKSAGFSVTVDVPSDLPAILADHHAFLLMLENLLDNAIQYSGDDRRVEISGRRSGSTVLLVIHDHGRGIPPDEIGKVTRKFYRGRNAVSGGTGLGLAIATRIAIGHGGALRIESLLGRGTTVTVTLPAMAPGQDQPDSPDALTSASDPVSNSDTTSYEA